MKTQLTAVLLGAALALAACGGSDDTPPPTTQVPGSASASASGFITYLKALTASSGTDALEPVDVGSVTAPPADDTSEPQVVD